MGNKVEQLEARLHTAEPPIVDDGFSDAVLVRLPSRRLRARTARCLSLAIASGIGSLVTLLGVSPEIMPLKIVPAVIAESGMITMSLLTSVAMVAVFMVPVAWLVYAEMAVPDSRYE